MTSGTIGKEQLQTLLQNLYPREDPKTIQELATLYLSEVDQRNQAVDFKDRSGVDAKQLLTVGAEMSLKRRDWKRLANNLGLAEEDCFCLEQEHLGVKNQAKTQKVFVMYVYQWENQGLNLDQFRFKFESVFAAVMKSSWKVCVE